MKMGREQLYQTLRAPSIEIKYFQSEGGPSARLCGLQLLGTQDPPILTPSVGDVELPP